MSADALGTRRTLAAYTQSTFREVNRRIAAISQRCDYPAHYVCECLNVECIDTIALTAEEYDLVRSDPACFFVLEGHEVADVEATVGRTDRYLVVRKLGAGAETAAELQRRYSDSV